MRFRIPWMTQWDSISTVPSPTPREEAIPCFIFLLFWKTFSKSKQTHVTRFAKRNVLCWRVQFYRHSSLCYSQLQNLTDGTSGSLAGCKGLRPGSLLVIGILLSQWCRGLSYRQTADFWTKETSSTAAVSIEVFHQNFLTWKGAFHDFCLC